MKISKNRFPNRERMLTIVSGKTKLAQILWMSRLVGHVPEQAPTWDLHTIVLYVAHQVVFTYMYKSSWNKLHS